MSLSGNEYAHQPNLLGRCTFAWEWNGRIVFQKLANLDCTVNTSVKTRQYRIVLKPIGLQKEIMEDYYLWHC